MIYKYLGAILIMAGCGGLGFSIAAGCRREESMLQQLLEGIRYMECELQYRLSPLPELCQDTAKHLRGPLQSLFLQLSRELADPTAEDVSACMRAALKAVPPIPRSLCRRLSQLGNSLGQFDLPGQLRGLQAVSAGCLEDLRALRRNQEERLKSYQTLGICAGGALVILFL